VSIPRRIPILIHWIVSGIVPADRREDVLGDLEATLAEREARLGRRSARLGLWRELWSLLAWRMRLGLGSAGRHRVPSSAPLPPSGPPDPRPVSKSVSWRGDFWQDLRFGCRTLLRRPGFAFTAILVLALGIGSTTSVFTLVNRIHFDRPDHVVEPHRLVRLWRAWEDGTRGGSLSHPDYVDLRAAASTLSGLAAYTDGGVTALYSIGGGETEQVEPWFVSSNYFEVLGVRPALGRFFLPEEDATPGTHMVAVLSHDFWERAFGADPAVVGKTLSLGGEPVTVVGVAPERFHGPSPIEERAEVWLPIAMYGALARPGDSAWWERLPDASTNWLTLVGRLAPAVTFEAAQANLAAVSRPLYEERPRGEHLEVSREYLYSPGQATSLKRLSILLLSAVAIVLAIAVANVSVLLLSRAATRAQEMGIRTSVGASRTRILRLVLAESLVLTLAGAALGAALAFATGEIVASLLPFTFETSFRPDARVLAATLGVSLIVATAVGLAPALHAARGDLSRLASGTRSTPLRLPLRDTLVVGQVALSLVLVAGAALFTRSFLAARAEELGFETENRLLLEVNLRRLEYDRARIDAFVREGLDRLAALPGAVRVSTTMMVPFQGEWTSSIPTPPGGRATEPDGTIVSGMNLVGPGYFDLMGIEIVRGRALDASDDAGSPLVVVINEAMARAVWPDQDPLGKTLAIREGMDFRVVGVARDATYYELGEGSRTQTYGSQLQMLAPELTFLVQTEVPAAELARPAQSVLREIEPSLTYRTTSTLESAVENLTARYEATAVLVGTFGTMALLLAAAGLYGLVSFLVAGRTREIGVRIALGAGRRRVAVEVLGRGLGLGMTGIALGLLGAAAARRFTASLLYEVAPDDPLPLVAASCTLLLVAALASLAPARRATRVDPMGALRTD
jgi:predicted permease